jgi:hypothetical protein
LLLVVLASFFAGAICDKRGIQLSKLSRNLLCSHFAGVMLPKGYWSGIRSQRGSYKALDAVSAGAVHHLGGAGQQANILA